jgi:TrmH RNA methyltransferase
MKDSEITICGLAAVRARFQRDPGSIVRLFFDLPTSKKVGAMCSSMAATRKVYRCVEPKELEKIADSIHHGGIVAVVEDTPPPAPKPADVAVWGARRENLVVLDRIGNAHNLGAIVRTAAYFAVPRIVIEGGMDAVEICATPSIPAFLRTLAASGYDVVGAATRGGKAGAPGAPRGAPWALVLGNEEHGLASAVASSCTRLVTIPGSGSVESLNVSAAAAILIHDLCLGAPEKKHRVHRNELPRDASAQ